MKTFLSHFWMIRNGRLENRDDGTQPTQAEIRTDPILRTLYAQAQQRNPDAPNVKAFLKWMDEA